MEHLSLLTASQLSATVNVTPDEVRVTIVDRDTRTLEFFANLSEEQYPEIARLAWPLGLRAVFTAHTLAQEARFEAIAKELLQNFGAQLSNFVADRGSLAQFLTNQGESIKTTIVSALNPALPDSVFGQFLAMLSSAMHGYATTLNTTVAESEKKNGERLDTIRQDITRLETRRADAPTTPRGGLEFQAAVFTFIREAMRGQPWLVDNVSEATGIIPYSKIGDLVISATDDNAFAGARIAVEAKQDRSYTETKADNELKIARNNRNTSVGLFVASASHAPNEFPAFLRHGRNVLCIWDQNDPATDIRLQCALFLATGLVPLNKRTDDQANINALAKVRERVEQELSRLTEFEKYNNKIRDASDGLAGEISTCRRQLGVLLREAEAVLAALNVELSDEEAERGTSIGFTR
jgi:hypothetical protein